VIEAERPSDVLGQRYAVSFRRKFLALTIGLLMVNLAIGLFARQQQQSIIKHAIDVYDTAFISTNYVNLAQLAFQHYVDSRRAGAASGQGADTGDLLDNVFDNMDVAIERSSSAAARVDGLDIRTKIAALRDIPANDPAFANWVSLIQKDMERLRQRNSDVGLKARDDIEEFSFESDLLLLCSVVISIVLAGLVLFVIHRMIGSLKRRSSEHLYATLHGMPQGLTMFDEQQRLIVCNAQYAAMYGLPDELARPGTALRSILEYRAAHGTGAADDEDFIADELTRAAQSAATTREQQLQDGRSITTIKAPLTTGGEVVIHLDVTEKRNSERQIAFLALHDALTGLANRVKLRKHIELALNVLARGGKTSVLCLDLDHFKSVNDTLGHSVGDALLCAVAKRLLDLVDEHDLVARTGGDEFAIVQSAADLTLDASAALATRIVETLTAPFEIGDHNVVIGASVGVAMAPGDGTDTDELLKNADLALYRAKDDGRARFHFFEPEMDVKAQARRALELDLRRAVGNGEFELFYQPIVNLEQNRIGGFEALLRWKHPTRGMVAPGEFIPLAEETGLIVPIGEWVIRQACAEAGSWPSDLSVAINVSPVQFRNKNLASTVISAIAAARLRPDRLELEITETTLMHNNEETLAILHQLHQVGVRISMDDFGTGYSSLSYLRSFPFDKIKIDKSFVRDLAEKPDAIAIIRAVTGLGRSIGVTTTAEGVETKEQLEQMRAEGCTEVQGYFYSRPIPGSEIASLLTGFEQNAQAA